VSPHYAAEKNRVLLSIYLDQREYHRAAALLDSVNWTLPLTTTERDIILLKTLDWERIIAVTNNELLKGIAYYNLGAFDQTVELLSEENGPETYRLIYLAKAYMELEDYENALNTIFLINTIGDYLFEEYQAILFKILLEIPNLDIVQAELNNLKDPALRTYVLLKVHEKKKRKKQLTSTAWKLIEDHPKSPAAYDALVFVKPKTKPENKAYGRVYYYFNEYSKALKYLNRGTLDDASNYYLGRIYYSMRKNHQALRHFAACSWSAAHYYRGRIYERTGLNDRAMHVYDSLAQMRKGSEYAIRGLKRKAFLLEELGDTLNAVETFLGIGERNTKFRAAMQLFRKGNLSKAQEVLANHDAPEFVYWQIKTRERLAEPTDSLEQYLSFTFPLSYYTLVRYNDVSFLDTLSLNAWLSQFSDTSITFSHKDSLHIDKAVMFFALNENEYALAELRMIEADDPQDLIHLSRLCAEHGADKESIRYGLKVKQLALERDIRTLPFELLRLQYPIRYMFSIMDNYGDLALSLAMIWQESLFDPYAISPANAKGIMQIIPATARLIAKELGEPEYTYSNPETSIRFGMYYFRKMLQEFKSVPLSLAAYNAGPIRVRRWIKNDPHSEMGTFIELIPYNETRNYVKYILARKEIYRLLVSS
jgi:soluble lytic murein transglycosylase